MKYLLCVSSLLALLSCKLVIAQVAPAIEWAKCFGGSEYDEIASVQQISDGGFIVGGSSYSNDGDVSGNHGEQDYWITKIDSAGNLTWQKTYGGSFSDRLRSIQQTADDGFIVAGYSYSNDGDITVNHGWDDYWIVKLDAAGNLVWQKSLGGSSYDEAASIQQTTDGGFIIAGMSKSVDGDITGNHGVADYWIVKLNSLGFIEWQKSLGGSSVDDPSSIQQTVDGGFIVCGRSSSINGDVTGNHGGYDYWVVKLDVLGNLIWQKSLGGSSDEAAASNQQTTDLGFIIAGETWSNDGDVLGNHSLYNDYWIVNLDTNGNLIWQKCLGGSFGEAANSVQESLDSSGFNIAGYSFSDAGDVSGNHDTINYYGDTVTTDDCWVVKLDLAGNILWQKSLGGTGVDKAVSMQQTTDGGYIVGGATISNNGDVSGNHGDYDYWIVKLAANVSTGISSSLRSSISLSPNPVQNLLTLVLSNFSEGGINFLSPSAAATIAVYDVAGRKIVLPTTISNNKVQFTTTTLPNGIYLLQIINNETGMSYVGKFVKE